VVGQEDRSWRGGYGDGDKDEDEVEGVSGLEETLNRAGLVRYT
jgi:hypothetical protein